MPGRSTSGFDQPGRAPSGGTGGVAQCVGYSDRRGEGTGLNAEGIRSERLYRRTNEATLIVSSLSPKRSFQC